MLVTNFKLKQLTTDGKCKYQTSFTFSTGSPSSWNFIEKFRAMTINVVLETFCRQCGQNLILLAFLRSSGSICSRRALMLSCYWPRTTNNAPLYLTPVVNAVRQSTTECTVYRLLSFLPLWWSWNINLIKNLTSTAMYYIITWHHKLKRITFRDQSKNLKLVNHLLKD